MRSELPIRSYNSPQTANRMHDQQENEAGYIYFVHKTTGERQNDNPKLLDILKVVHQDYKSIKYITYRCATKLWLLKQSFYTVNIPYDICVAILEHHGFNHQTANSPAIKPNQLTAILHDIYFAAEKCGHFAQSINFDLGRCSALLAGFLWAVFDPNRLVPISLLELKQTLLVLCNTHDFNQLVAEEFVLAADHNRCVSRFRFEAILKVISKLFCYLGEGQHYGPQFIYGWVDEVFEQCPGIIGLNEYQFHCLWENQSINFAYYANVLALLKRINESQSIVHDAQCVSCKVAPIQGIQFKCQQCRKVSLCYECFCNGYRSSRHELSHRMFEISTNEIVANKFCTFLSKILNIFVRRSEAPNNLTIETQIADEKETNANNATVTIECINDMKFNSIRGSRQLKDTTDQIISFLPSSTMNNATTKDRLLSIIDLLAHQTEQFNQQILVASPKSRKANTKLSKKEKKRKATALDEHHIFLLEVINQLRDICNGSTPAVPEPLPHASTPYRQSKRSELQQRRISIGSPLARSIHGTEINKSYLEKNKSDLSIGDISTWFQGRTSAPLINSTQEKKDILPTVTEGNTTDTDLHNFKELLHKVKEIMDDSFSDNVELSTAAHQLERVLDDIIDREENKRIQTYL